MHYAGREADLALSSIGYSCPLPLKPNQFFYGMNETPLLEKSIPTLSELHALRLFPNGLLK